MATKLVSGFESVGHIDGLAEDLSASYLRLDGRGAVVSLPSAGPAGDMFAAFLDKEDEKLPRNLRFVSTDGSVFLGECRDVGGTVSSLGTSLTRIRARRVIEAGQADVNYDEVDGMTTEIDGLSRWSEMSTVTQTLEREPLAVVLRAENQDEIVLGGAAAATVESSFSFNPSPKGNVFAITDLALLRTRSPELWPWGQHAAVHHMVQDLMCLLYAKPCTARVTSVKREDDQPYPTDDGKRYWRKVYDPSFGRSLDGIAPLDRAKAEPLFYLRDVAHGQLEKWIDEWHLWSRPTWIAVTTMFQRGTTVESQLLQIGVALEALGYALWQETSPPPGTRTPSYPELLELVTTAAAITHVRIYGEQSVGEWRSEFNAAFKGTKHADNPLPDGLSAHRLARQGLDLIRAWLGTRLGVLEQRIREGLDRQ